MGLETDLIFCSSSPSIACAHAENLVVGLRGAGKIDRVGTDEHDRPGGREAFGASLLLRRGKWRPARLK